VNLCSTANNVSKANHICNARIINKANISESNTLNNATIPTIDATGVSP
jgi:hypothetical protein